MGAALMPVKPPPGFVLDQKGQQEQKAPPEPPPGFVLDSQPETTARRETSTFEDVTETMARGMLRGIPFVGEHLESGVEFLESELTDRSQREIEARGEQLEEERPTLSTLSEFAGMFAIPGSAAGMIMRGGRAVQKAPLSFRMQTEAKRLFQQGNRKAGQEIWKRSKDVEQIERAIRMSRGRPDRLREQFDRLSGNNRFMRRLTDEQRMLIDEVRRENTVAGALRKLTSLQNTLVGSGGAGLASGDVLTGLGIAGASGAARMGARVLDRASTARAAQRALRGVERPETAARSRRFLGGN